MLLFSWTGEKWGADILKGPVIYFGGSGQWYLELFDWKLLPAVTKDDLMRAGKVTKKLKFHFVYKSDVFDLRVILIPPPLQQGQHAVWKSVTSLVWLSSWWGSVPRDEERWRRKLKTRSVTLMRQQRGNAELLSFATNWSCYCLICCYGGRPAGGGNLAARNAHFNSQTNTAQPERDPYRVRGRVLNADAAQSLQKVLTPQMCVLPSCRTWMTLKMRTSSSNRRIRLCWRWWVSWQGRTAVHSPDAAQATPPRPDDRSFSAVFPLLSTSMVFSVWFCLCLLVVLTALTCRANILLLLSDGDRLSSFTYLM